jgi:Ca2+-dependent lipid-binding protein
VELSCGKSVQKTKVKSNDLSPEFNETFEFSVNWADQILTVNVWDYDFVKSDHLLGTFEIPIFKLKAGETYNQW